MARIKHLLILALGIFCFQIGFGQTTIGNFALNDISGQSISLDKYQGKKAVVVIFTSSHCSYAKKYEGRLASMYQEFQAKGVQFIAVNSNDPTLSESDSPEVMRQLRPYPFPYLKDGDQAVAKMFGATKTPEAFILIPKDGSFTVAYQGKIDDNPLDANMVKKNFLANALNQTLVSQAVDPSAADASGCNIKWK